MNWRFRSHDVFLCHGDPISFLQNTRPAFQPKDAPAHWNERCSNPGRLHRPAQQEAMTVLDGSGSARTRKQGQAIEVRRCVRRNTPRTEWPSPPPQIRNTYLPRIHRVRAGRLPAGAIVLQHGQPAGEVYRELARKLHRTDRRDHEYNGSVRVPPAVAADFEPVPVALHRDVQSHQVAHERAIVIQVDAA